MVKQRTPVQLDRLDALDQRDPLDRQDPPDPLDQRVLQDRQDPLDLSVFEVQEHSMFLMLGQVVMKSMGQITELSFYFEDLLMCLI
jgi:hypothetical protein